MEWQSTEAIKKAVEAGLGVSILSAYAVALELKSGRLCRSSTRHLSAAGSSIPSRTRTAASPGGADVSGTAGGRGSAGGGLLQLVEHHL